MAFAEKCSFVPTTTYKRSIRASGATSFYVRAARSLFLIRVSEALNDNKLRCYFSLQPRTDRILLMICCRAQHHASSFNFSAAAVVGVWLTQECQYFFFVADMLQPWAGCCF